MTDTIMVPPAREGKELENPEREDINPDLIGNCGDREETRNRWIDTVEKMLEFDAFCKGEISSMKKFEEVMIDGDYGLNEPEKWMLAPELN